MSACPYCNQDIEDQHNFCLYCRHQVRCVACRNALELNADMCFVCGQETVQHKPANEFTLEEKHTKSSSFRRVHAVLTNPAFNEAAQVFMGVTGGRIVPPDTRLPSYEQPALEASLGSHEPPSSDQDGRQNKLPTDGLESETKTQSDYQAKESNASTWFRKVDDNLIPKITDFKGKTKKAQQQRFIVLYVWGFLELIDNSGPTQEQVYSVSKAIDLFDQNTSKYFGDTAHEYLMNIDSKFSLKPSGEKFVEEVLLELQDTQADAGFDYLKSGSSKSKRSRMSNEDAQVVDSWVQQPVDMDDFDITSLDTARKAAMFALWSITKKLGAVKAVKSRVAHSYLMKRYETISIKYEPFRRILSNKQHAKWFQVNEDKAYYLTSAAQKEVETWIKNKTAGTTDA